MMKTWILEGFEDPRLNWKIEFEPKTVESLFVFWGYQTSFVMVIVDHQLIFIYSNGAW